MPKRKDIMSVLEERLEDLGFPSTLCVDGISSFSADCANAILALIAADLNFQSRVSPWMQSCFGPKVSADTVERNHRFLEEALELVQALGCTRAEALQLVDYVYGRPVGEPAQEVGGVMVTLAALCLASGLDMHIAGNVELERVWNKIEQIRAKQRTKPKFSPLPQAETADPRDAALRQALEALTPFLVEIAAKGMRDDFVRQNPSCDYWEIMLPKDREPWLDDARAAIAAIQAADAWRIVPKEQGWQPIETAPRDGVHIWLFSPRGTPQQFAGFWHESFCSDGGFWSHVDTVHRYDWADWSTHWRPLPAPPALKGEK